MRSRNQVAPFEIDVDDSSKITTVTLDASSAFEWHDQRLFDSSVNPCLGVMSSIISMSQDESASDITRVDKSAKRARFWMPEPSVEPRAERKTQLSRRFLLTTTEAEYRSILRRRWTDVAQAPTTEITPGVLAGQVDAAYLRAWLWVSEVFTIKQRHFDYFYYPFDYHCATIPDCFCRHTVRLSVFKCVFDSYARRCQHRF
jgi:hypothetical protein